MLVESLIKPPTLTRELTFELAGVAYFIDEEFLQRYTGIPFRQELEEFLEASTRMRLFNFPPLYNDIEGFLQASLPPGESPAFRKKFRMKFPYLATLDPIVVFFIPANKQAAALSSLFLADVISKIMQVYGQSKSLITHFREAERHFQSCKAPSDNNNDEYIQIKIQRMPFDLFNTLAPALGKKPLLSLYHRSLDKLESQYSNLASFGFLRNSIGQLINEHEQSFTVKPAPISSPALLLKCRFTGNLPVRQRKTGFYMVTIYTDGSSLGNPGPGGYGIVLKYKDLRKEMSQGYRSTTNNRMELLAVIKGLQALKKPNTPVTVYSDSKYVIDSVEKGWLWGWIKKGFKGKKNKDLWMQFAEIYKVHRVRFQWVKGHAGIPENERCDQLAVQAAESGDHLVDVAFENGINEVQRL